MTNGLDQLLHTIGNVYMMKATTFMKSKKFLGMCASLHFCVHFRPLTFYRTQPRILLASEGEGYYGKGDMGRHRLRVSLQDIYSSVFNLT